ncbi:MAG: hypothetical protein JNK87_35885 [Bryobacterales bacterium]|nr:hypothetical protein [Bryobacterales bacterium]
MTGRDTGENLTHLWEQRCQICEPIRASLENYDRDATMPQVLLVGDLLVGRDHHREASFLSGIEKGAVLESGQLGVCCGSTVMLRKRVTQALIPTLVEEYVH